MRPLDPRLMRYAQSARRHILVTAILGIVTAALVIIQSILIASTLAPVVESKAPLSSVLLPFGCLIGVFILRALLLGLRETLAQRAAEATISELRAEVLSASVAHGPRWLAENGAKTTTLMTRGLDDLGPYFVRFLPQLIMVMTVTPMAMATILYFDFWSAVITVLTVPLIPIFMILIGRFTQDATSARLASMQQLSAQLLDLIAGLPTLRALGRENSPQSHLAKLGKKNTRVTMSTLKIAFLSGGVLEFLATLSVALVAVEVGMRLVYSHIDLFSALVVIMLAPEVFEPLRQVGAQYHASANGVAAANKAFDIIESPRIGSTENTQNRVDCPDLRSCDITFTDLSVAARGAWAPAHLTGTIRPGIITALVGKSGAGKSTTVSVLLGLLPHTQGSVMVGEIAREDISDDSMWEQVMWVPQRPTILPGTLRSQLPSFESEAALEEAALATGFASVISQLPQGWDTVVGHAGVGLSVGQRQRFALTCALLSDAPLIIVDEPTAHLDAVSEDIVVATLQALASRGRTVLLITHRASLLKIADYTIAVESAAASADDIARWPILDPQAEHSVTDFALPELLSTADVRGGDR